MSHTIKGTVHVDMRAGGIDHSGTYGPGDVDLPGPVAELLEAQGLATPAKGGKPAKATDQDAAPAAAPSTDTPTED